MYLNMKSFSKSIPIIVNLIFATVFLTHIAIIGYRRKYPENPSVRVFDKDLKDIEFPLSFKICIRKALKKALFLNFKKCDKWDRGSRRFQKMFRKWRYWELVCIWSFESFWPISNTRTAKWLPSFLLLVLTLPLCCLEWHLNSFKSGPLLWLAGGI